MTKPYTEKEIQFLKDNYPSKGRKFCAEALGRSENNVKTKVKKLKLRRLPNWSEEDIKLIKKYYNIKGIKYCSELLNKKFSTVAAMGRRLNLTKSHHWSEYELNIIKTHYTESGVEGCMKYLDRKERNIKLKAKELGLFVNKNYINWGKGEDEFLIKNYKLKTTEEISNILGVSKYIITKKLKELNLKKTIKRGFSTEDFIKRSKKLHGDKYDYCKVNYVNNNTKVILICSKHGEFSIKPKNHYRNKCSCPKCIKRSSFNTELLVDRFRDKYGDSFDYSKVNYINNKTKVTITCQKHGDFDISHLSFLKSGCPSCNKIDTEDFIKRGKEIHGDDFTYEKTIYENREKELIVTCKNGHDINVKPNNFYKTKKPCYVCHIPNRLKTIEWYVNEFNKNHNNKYTYPNISNDIKYTSNNIIDIECPVHGLFKQRISNHLKNRGCHRCWIESSSLTNEEFIKEAIEIHGNKYDYSKTNYINAKTKVTITCPIHGDFIQCPRGHRLGAGCKSCYNGTSRGEKEISDFLTKHSINNIPQYSFDDCRNIVKLIFDFYLPDYNLLIEYNGIQHYEIVDFFGGEERFKKRIVRDKIKVDYCSKDENPNLLIIRYDEDVNEVLENYFNKKRED